MSSLLVVPSDITIIEEKNKIAKRRIRTLEKTGLAMMLPVFHWRYSKLDKHDMYNILRRKFDPSASDPAIDICRRRQESVRRRVIAQNGLLPGLFLGFSLPWWSLRKYNYQSKLIALPFCAYLGAICGRIAGHGLSWRWVETDRQRMLAFRHASLVIPPRDTLTLHKAPPHAIHRFALWPALVNKAMRRLRRLPASGAHNILLHIARSKGPRGPNPVTVAPLCRAVLMKVVWHERDDPQWMRTAAGVCGLAVSRVGVDWKAHIPVRYRAAVLRDISRAVESVAEAIDASTDGSSIGYVCEAVRTLGLESKQFTNTVMDAIANTADEGRKFGPLSLVQVVSFLADYAVSDSSRTLPDGLGKIVEWRVSCHWPEISGQNLADLLVGMESLGWLSDELIVNSARRVAFTLHASLRPQDILKILPIIVRSSADLEDSTIIDASRALVGRMILFSKLDIILADVTALLMLWREAVRSGHGELFPSGFKPWLRNQLAIRGDDTVNSSTVMDILEAMHTGQPQTRDALSLGLSGVLPSCTGHTLLRYLHYLSFYFTPSGAASAPEDLFDWTESLLKAVRSNTDFASLALGLGVCARVDRVDSATALLTRFTQETEMMILSPSGSPRDWALWAGIYDSMARLRLRDFCSDQEPVVLPVGLSSATMALLVHACYVLDIKVDLDSVLASATSGFGWSSLSAEGMSQLLVALWAQLDLGFSGGTVSEAGNSCRQLKLYAFIEEGLQTLSSRLDALPMGTDLPRSLPLLAAMVGGTARRSGVCVPLRCMEVFANISEFLTDSESSSLRSSSSSYRTEVYSTLKRLVQVDNCLPFKEALVKAQANPHRLRTGGMSQTVLHRRLGQEADVEAGPTTEDPEDRELYGEDSVTISRRVSSGVCGIPIDLLFYKESVLRGVGFAPTFVGGGVRFTRERPESRMVPEEGDATEKSREKFREAAVHVKMHLYDLLHVARDSDADGIRQGYLEQSKLHHPDKRASQGGDPEAFRQINYAYRVLSNPTMRAFYDKYGPEGISLADGIVVKQDETLANLERRVRAMVRSNEEMKVQRMFQLQGEMTTGLKFRDLHSAPRWAYTSFTHGMGITAGRHNFTVVTASHVQANGGGVGKMTFFWQTGWSPYMQSRVMVDTVAGQWWPPAIEGVVTRQVGQHSTLRQTVSWTQAGGVGAAMTWGLQLFKDWSGSVTLAVGHGNHAAFEIEKTNPEIGGDDDLARMKAWDRCTMKYNFSIEGEGNVAFEAKAVLPFSGGFEISCGPTMSLATGAGIELKCSQQLNGAESLSDWEELDGAFPTLVQWSLMLRWPNFDSAILKFRFTRGGAAFTLPLEFSVPGDNTGVAMATSIFLAAPLAVKVVRETVRRLKKD
ncbi:DnaJ (Hsp40), sub C, member 11 [Perkinsus chesapeaki]|uniref:DnaJ (Hsp40), sub C, member 11 n=1 Tax=Perkinsus chesapeaki TaxID=330153 RepID=A0A7J6N3I0_PERCH|nr:DnaJ (Hsp40), sub C, member 11 [Perkinsus chesapeaki]